MYLQVHLYILSSCYSTFTCKQVHITLSVSWYVLSYAFDEPLCYGDGIVLETHYGSDLGVELCTNITNNLPLRLAAASSCLFWQGCKDSQFIKGKHMREIDDNSIIIQINFSIGRKLESLLPVKAKCFHYGTIVMPWLWLFTLTYAGKIFNILLSRWN